MTQMGDAFRSCMEQLLLVREEKERLITEAANKISSEQKKARDLQQKLENANKRFAKVTNENYNYRNSVNSKDKLIRELSESKEHSEQKLTEATTRLESTQKQCASLQYEVRMLQKELEIRNKEREYDVKSIDAAQKQQQESVKKITTLEAECQRLRTLVQKRLPGPAALAKMKDEVERRGTSSVENRTRKSHTAVQPSLQAATRRYSVSEGHVLKLQEMDGENRHLRQLLAKKESELQFVQLQYADEACKLSIVQRQLKELSGNHDLEKNNHSEQLASSVVSKPVHFRVAKQHTFQSRSRTIAGSDMQLLVDLAEIEKLEMASRPSSAPHQNATDESDTDSKMVRLETVHRDQIPQNGLFDKYPEWIQDVLKLIIQKHQDNKISVDVIVDVVTHALRSEISSKENGAASFSYDHAEIDSMVATLIERVSCMIERSTENNVVSFQSLLQEKTELTTQLEHLVHVCSDVLDGKANLQKFIDEVCLTLEWVVNRCFSCIDGVDIVDHVTSISNGNESLRTLSMHEKQAMQSAKSKMVLEMQKELQKELIGTTEGQFPDDILENHSQIQFATCKVDEKLLAFRQEQGDNCQDYQLVYCDAKGAAGDGSMENLPEEGKQLITNSAISAASEKLAECQETITNISKQLQALQSPVNADALEKEYSDTLPLLVAKVLSEEDAKPKGFISPTSEEVTCKKEHGGPVSTEKNLVHEQDAGTDHKSDSNGSTQLVLRPVIPKSPRTSVSVDMKKKKKKRRASLLSRLTFRNKS